MTRKLKVGIVGCGAGRTHLLEGYAVNPALFEVVALCDLDPARLDAVGEEFGVAIRIRDYAQLLGMEDLDVVDICTPPALHFAQAMAALRADKHVICEKPLAGSLAEVDALAAAEQASAGRLMPVFQYRYGNGIAKAKALIEAGVAGALYAGTVETFWRRGAEYYAVPWRGNWRTELGGVLMAHAIHPHDMLTYLVGPVRRVFGRVATRVNPIETEDCASASLVMAEGALVSLTATLGSVDQITRIRLAFENMTIESDHAPFRPGEADWTITPRTAPVAEAVNAVLEGWTFVPSRHATQLRLFGEAILADSALPVTIADARRALELVTGIYDSSATGKDVALPITSDHPRYHSWVPAEFR